MLFGEVVLPIDLIGADPHSLGPVLCELGGQVAEMTALLRSAGCHRSQVEEQHERTSLNQL